MNSPTANDADSRKDVPFGVSLTFLPVVGVKSPENPNFWCVNRRFQAKLAKYWKFHVIETPASISTKFLHNDGDHQVVVVGGPNRRPTNPRWRTAAILKTPLKRRMSATVWPILMKFGMMTHIPPYSGKAVKISNFWKFKMAAAAIVENHKNRDISGTVWSIFTKFGTLMQNGSLNRPDC